MNKINDFYYLCKYITTFVEEENFTEEKYKIYPGDIINSTNNK